MIEAMGHLDMQRKPQRIDVPTTERQLSTNVILPTDHGFDMEAPMSKKQTFATLDGRRTSARQR